MKTCSLRAEVQSSVPRRCSAGSDIDEGTSFVGCSWRVQEVAITEGQGARHTEREGRGGGLRGAPNKA